MLLISTDITFLAILAIILFVVGIALLIEEGIQEQKEAERLRGELIDDDDK